MIGKPIIEKKLLIKDFKNLQNGLKLQKLQKMQRLFLPKLMVV
jgi:hypothetical protein